MDDKIKDKTVKSICDHNIGRRPVNGSEIESSTCRLGICYYKVPKRHMVCEFIAEIFVEMRGIFLGK